MHVTSETYQKISSEVHPQNNNVRGKHKPLSKVNKSSKERLLWR